MEDYLWVKFELEEATVVDAIRYLPRPGGGNGDITGYRVEGERWEEIKKIPHIIDPKDI